MRPDPDKLEAELSKLEPAPLPAGLEFRLRSVPDEATAAKRSFFFRAVVVLPLAAALFLSFAGLLAWHWMDSSSSGDAPAVVQASPDVPASSRFRVVRAENHLANRIDEGVFIVGDSIAARQYRYQFIDTVVWENPRDGSTMEMSVPREEVVLVPLHAF